MFSLKFWKRKKRDSAKPMETAGKMAGNMPKMLGTFEVIREIGRGSMGVVYLGHDVGSGVDVALKTMSLGNQFNAKVLQDTRERFMREAEILTWLHHPDIVVIYDVGEEHGLAYIAMEYLKGVELTEYTRPDNLLPLPKALEIMARAADALGYAHEEGHELGIVHRDVKPGNIMYDAAENSVKLTDFGISRLMDLNSTRVGLVLGTPLYMSPEQVMGNQVNHLSDLFSLGATLYQLVSGKLPFEGNTDFEVMGNIVQKPHTDILSVRPDLPREVCEVINRALEKDPERRFQSGAEMAEAIRRCIPYCSNT
ncbi:MAG TPA: serine/threonine-protein kinase [Gallionellaceae bacterium]